MDAQSFNESKRSDRWENNAHNHCKEGDWCIGYMTVNRIHDGDIDYRKNRGTFSTRRCPSKPSRPSHLSHSSFSSWSCPSTPRLVIIIITIHNPPKPHPSPPIILPSGKQSSSGEETSIPILWLPCAVIIIIVVVVGTIVNEPSTESAGGETCPETGVPPRPLARLRCLRLWWLCKDGLGWGWGVFGVRRRRRSLTASKPWSTTSRSSSPTPTPSSTPAPTPSSPATAIAERP